MSGKTNIDKENAVRILDFWFLMEFLNQQSTKSFKEIEKKATTYKNDLSSGRIKRPKKVVITSGYKSIDYMNAYSIKNKKYGEKIAIPLSISETDNEYLKENPT